MQELGYYTDGPEMILENGKFEPMVGGLVENFVVGGEGPPDFEVSDLSTNRKTVEPGELVTASVRVTNTGERKDLILSNSPSMERLKPKS
ncbi:hypothetical protein AKJ57_01775 [candidate division MSBL1 archaeon SCGC-AAA259A05]|uniref:CARDB domain-containing protein n=1 Tax=candidate division MSBL1 archaeon SCGC-AAA259A05 TaxID=1698259 RepID=A0A133UAR9_9EURY|nr:hypothetical protein AKJ57_01775 [candidate division MSBL1 archaeon SCGC-AAA259A05]